MTPLIAIAGLISVAALTPGPNNLIVLRAAAHGGMADAAPAIFGIVAGGLVLLGMVIAGAGVLFARWPQLPGLLCVAGGAYLAWLGIRLMSSVRSTTPAPAAAPTRIRSAGALPAGGLGVFFFQFLNPKSWIMAITAISAARADAAAIPHWQIGLMFVLIPTACLLGWSSLGVLMRTPLQRPAVQRGFDRSMGALLLASAALLLARA
jgi:threonine/homoserine/homoserine lactone efflux protein